MKAVVLLLLLIPMTIFSQNSELSMFDNLVDKKWKAEGTWENGTIFKQEIEINYSLDRMIVLTNSKGFIDKEQIKFGLRNHGIRMFDKKSDSVKFWEFDIFGKLTEGVVLSIEKNIIYQYAYGNSFLTEMWEYVNDSTYNFKIGSYENGVWKKLYLTTQFIEITADGN